MKNIFPNTLTALESNRFSKYCKFKCYDHYFYRAHSKIEELYSRGSEWALLTWTRFYLEAAECYDGTY